MKSIFTVVLLGLISLQLFADMDPGPDQLELSKAPAWPNKYTPDTNRAPQACRRPGNYDDVINALNRGETQDSFMFIAREFVDLNLDGNSGVILLQKYTCGTEGCSTNKSLIFS